MFYREALASAGFEVLSERDGESGLSHLRTPQPVIVALDLVLPGMGGVEFIRNLRIQRSMAPPPVVVLPLLDVELAAAATTAGAARILSRDQSPVRTLVLLAHTHARLRGTPTPPRPPEPLAWLPHAAQHVVGMHEALHALTRNGADVAARRSLAADAHGLAELLHLAGEAGLAELATALEAMIIGLRHIEAELTRSALQSLGQTVDFLGAQLEKFVPGDIRSVIGSRILVVDDEPSVCQLVSAALELSQIKPQIAASPTDCLRAVGESKFDLIVLDVGLPEMSGFDLCTKIRSTPGHANVPILFLTGLTSFQNRAKSALIGGNDFICKPFDPLELGLKVQLWIQLCRSGRK